MSTQTVEVVVTSPLIALGKSWQTGATIKIDPLMANQLLASGRARLRDAADHAALAEAETDHTRRVCALESSRWRVHGTR